jgi:hypothetical protein
MIQIIKHYDYGVTPTGLGGGMSIGGGGSSGDLVSTFEEDGFQVSAWVACIVRTGDIASAVSALDRSLGRIDRELHSERGNYNLIISGIFEVDFD